jgi:hypothetical protein
LRTRGRRGQPPFPARIPGRRLRSPP